MAINILEYPNAVKLISEQALNKVIDDAQKAGYTLPMDVLMLEITEHPESNISKRFFHYLKLGQLVVETFIEVKNNEKLANVVQG